MSRENMPHAPWRSRRAGLALMLALLAAATAPAVASSEATKGAAAAAAPAQQKSAAPLDINTASRAQLKKLPWIGDAEADRIIAARPYVSKADIVENAGIPVGVYQVIRHRIAVYPKTMPHPKTKS